MMMSTIIVNRLPVMPMTRRFMSLKNNLDWLKIRSSVKNGDLTQLKVKINLGIRGNMKLYPEDLELCVPKALKMLCYDRHYINDAYIDYILKNIDRNRPIRVFTTAMICLMKGNYHHYSKLLLSDKVVILHGGCLIWTSLIVIIICWFIQQWIDEQMLEAILNRDEEKFIKWFVFSTKQLDRNYLKEIGYWKNPAVMSMVLSDRYHFRSKIASEYVKSFDIIVDRDRQYDIVKLFLIDPHSDLYDNYPERTRTALIEHLIVALNKNDHQTFDTMMKNIALRKSNDRICSIIKEIEEHIPNDSFYRHSIKTHLGIDHRPRNSSTDPNKEKEKEKNLSMKIFDNHFTPFCVTLGVLGAILLHEFLD